MAMRFGDFAHYSRIYRTGSAYSLQNAACQMDYSRWIGDMDIDIGAAPTADFWMGGPLDAPDHIPTGVVETHSLRFTPRGAE